MDDIVIRECVTIAELDSCVHLQRDVFGLPDLEISPRRHLVVSKQAGGWTLGAFENGGHGELVGFVHHMAAVRNDEIFGYSHMMAVNRDYQNKGVGARLKWAQRAKALSEGRDFIKWTWDPMQARNAHFNLNRLGVTVTSYAENFYGTDYGTEPTPGSTGSPGIDSDRLFANWFLTAPRVLALADGLEGETLPPATREIVIPADWTGLIKSDPQGARQEQLRVRDEFQRAFETKLVCAGFERGTVPKYLLYKPQLLGDFAS